jgi:hypothetical protein
MANRKKYKRKNNDLQNIYPRGIGFGALRENSKLFSFVALKEILNIGNI